MQVTLNEWQMVTLLETLAEELKHAFEQSPVYQDRLQTLYDTLQGVYNEFLKTQGRLKE